MHLKSLITLLFPLILNAQEAVFEAEHFGAEYMPDFLISASAVPLYSKPDQRLPTGDSLKYADSTMIELDRVWWLTKIGQADRIDEKTKKNKHPLKYTGWLTRTLKAGKIVALIDIELHANYFGEDTYHSLREYWHPNWPKSVTLTIEEGQQIEFFQYVGEDQSRYARIGGNVYTIGSYYPKKFTVVENPVNIFWLKIVEKGVFKGWVPVGTGFVKISWERY